MKKNKMSYAHGGMMKKDMMDMKKRMMKHGGMTKDMDKKMMYGGKMKKMVGGGETHGGSGGAGSVVATYVQPGYKAGE